jgi:hypothetical protein
MTVSAQSESTDSRPAEKPDGRKLLAEESLMDRIDVLGTGKVKLHPSASARLKGGTEPGMGLDC